MLPIPGGLSSKIVQSGSMEPKIPTGALVIVKPAATYAVGDVITFNKQGPVPTTHRIKSIEGSGSDTKFVTKGDANEEADPGVVPQARVLGKVVLSLPYVGYILHTARQPVGFALLIALPAFLVIIEEALSLWGAVSARRTQKAVVAVAPGRQRISDDIFRTAVVQHHRGAKRIMVMGASGLLVMATLGGGHTLAALSDTEKSVGNILVATTWEPLPIIPFANPFLLAEPEMLTAEGESDAASSNDEVASSTEPVVEEESAVVPTPEPEPEPEPAALAPEEEVVPNEPLEPTEEQATPQQGEPAQD